MRTYELFLHYKQGDDFGICLHKCGGDVVAALKMWREELLANSAHCSLLSERLVGVKVEVHADTHFIGFSPLNEEAEQCLNKLVAEELLTGSDWEDEDDLVDNEESTP